MTCAYTLPARFETTHPEITCLLERPHPIASPRIGKEIIAPQAWYDREIGLVLDGLPDDAPSQQHYDLAVYWLAQAALQRLIESLHEGEITMAGYSWCRDQIRIWHEDHRAAAVDPSSQSASPATGPAARAWAKAVVREALAD